MKKICLLILMFLVNVVFAQAPKLLNFNLATDAPTVLENVVIFINPETLYESSREVHIFLKPTLKLNGNDTSEPYVFLKTSDEQWTFFSGAFSQSGTYTLRVDFYLEDYKADEIRSDITGIESRLEELEDMIAVETDPIKKQLLIDEKKLKKQMKTDLQKVLTQIRINIGYDQFEFVVSGN